MKGMEGPLASALWGLLFLLIPAFILLITSKAPFLKKAGPVVVTYAVGLFLGNCGLLPAGFSRIQDLLTTITVPLSLPLIFFSLDLGTWKSIAGPGIRSLAGALLAVVLGTFATFLLFGSLLGKEAWKVAGMLVGVYTGGTPNLASIGSALSVDSRLYVAIHGSDVVISSFLLLGIITIFPPIARGLLPSFRTTSKNKGDEAADSYDANFNPLKRGDLGDIAKGLLLSGIIFAIGASAMLILPSAIALPTVIIVITSLGVGASFIPAVRTLKKSFQSGFYLILIFSLTVSSMANIDSLARTAPSAMIYVSILLSSITLLHFLFSFLLKVDADTHLITATAFILSPPFVPLVAASLRNREIVVPGIIIGVIGWVIGNYLGLAMAGLLSIL
ncbi:DUF819 family protein [Sediminispirochaeta smaragdinae]|uniref:DUF819 family protein n=1 Tax=Sediminispirochaeta smaragdinae (strain DSM 11293 / JCM 15392 / SEBR 4228) TaxID=573413 RepID=E1R933_SEDSS|nr:DUF819 family protein [Sediminispirochaeta smaragdinae]ADK83002.1 protein of unknown function DUF819 [Sediminispirochaeta smaragdinae DSM 11293]